MPVKASQEEEYSEESIIIVDDMVLRRRGVGEQAMVAKNKPQINRVTTRWRVPHILRVSYYANEGSRSRDAHLGASMRRCNGFCRRIDWVIVIPSANTLHWRDNQRRNRQHVT